VTSSKGYPNSLTCFQPQYRNLTTDLLNMISEPLRDSILAQYGFDVDKTYAWMFSPLLSNPCNGDPSDSITLLDNGCSYATLVLYWQDVLGNHGIPSDVENRYLQCFPESLAKGNEILAIINDTKGYDTPAKTRTILHRIIDDNQLQDDIGVP